MYICRDGEDEQLCCAHCWCESHIAVVKRDLYVRNETYKKGVICTFVATARMNSCAARTAGANHILRLSKETYM